MFSSNKPRFICDENIPIKVTELLREKGFDVIKAPLSFTDKEIAKIAKKESRIILTFDKHFINRRLFSPGNYYGIIFLQIHPPTIDTIFSSLINLFDKVSPDEFKGKLFILSLFGFRVKQ